MNITAHNVHDIPTGTRLQAFWGCPVDTGGGDWPDNAPQHEEGRVIGHEINPHRDWPTAFLIVETDEGRTHKVGRLDQNGIGWSIAK